MRKGRGRSEEWRLWRSEFFFSFSLLLNLNLGTMALMCFGWLVGFSRGKTFCIERRTKNGEIMNEELVSNEEWYIKIAPTVRLSRLRTVQASTQRANTERCLLSKQIPSNLSST